MHPAFAQIPESGLTVTVDQLADVLHAHWQMFGRLHQLLSHAIEDGRLLRHDVPDDYQALTEALAECAGPAAAAEVLLDRVGMGKRVDVDHDHQHAYARHVKKMRDGSIRSAEKAAFAYYLQAEGEERANAAGIHENIFCAAQVAGVFAETVEEASWARN
jgi:hypothetical protein